MLGVGVDAGRKPMKSRMRAWILLCAGLVAFGAAPREARPAGPRPLVVVGISVADEPLAAGTSTGAVQRIPFSGWAWEDLRVGLEVEPGDELRSNDSRATVKLSWESESGESLDLVLSDGFRASFLAREAEWVQIDLKAGGSFSQGTAGSSISAGGNTAASQGTSYGVRVLPQPASVPRRAVACSVFEGSVAWRSVARALPQRVRAGRQVWTDGLLDSDPTEIEPDGFARAAGTLAKADVAQVAAASTAKIESPRLLQKQLSDAYEQVLVHPGRADSRLKLATAQSGLGLQRSAIYQLAAAKVDPQRDPDTWKGVVMAAGEIGQSLGFKPAFVRRFGDDVAELARRDPDMLKDASWHAKFLEVRPGRGTRDEAKAIEILAAGDFKTAYGAFALGLKEFDKAAAIAREGFSLGDPSGLELPAARLRAVAGLPHRGIELGAWQPHAAWLERFARRGWVQEAELARRLRAAKSGESAVDTFWVGVAHQQRGDERSHAAAKFLFRKAMMLHEEGKGPLGDRELALVSRFLRGG
jgi:hypothetical protein